MKQQGAGFRKSWGACEGHADGGGREFSGNTRLCLAKHTEQFGSKVRAIQFCQVNGIFTWLQCYWQSNVMEVWSDEVIMLLR